MRFDIITIFPDILDSYTSKGMLRIAQEKKLIEIKAHDLRKFAVNDYGQVDDRPYGGGPGQVLMVEPVYKALRTVCKGTTKHKNIEAKKRKDKKNKIILLSARGKTWNQGMAREFAKLDRIIFICPRYEGHDERIRKFVDEEVSIGDYVLTGGELGAAVIIDSVTRLIPGVLGKAESLKTESHSTPGYREYPQYTRPEIFSYSKTSKTSKKKKVVLKVPKVLLSGHHKKIEEWRREHEK